MSINASMHSPAGVTLECLDSAGYQKKTACVTAEGGDNNYVNLFFVEGDVDVIKQIQAALTTALAFLEADHEA